MKQRRINELSIVDLSTQSELERNQLNKKVLLFAIAVIFLVTLIISVLTTIDVLKLANDLPDANLLKAYKPDQTTLIYDMNNNLVANIHGDEDRVIIPLSKISPYLQRAVIAIEDNRFYDHKGVDLIGTLRAGFSNFFGGGESLQGGSTLTQQLVKNSFLSPERSIKRKLIEAILAIRVERSFSKDKILEMYLNQIYWGRLCYGVEKAARRYFRKPAADLNLAESALLAGIIRAPEAYSPYSNFPLAKLRQKLVLERMEYYGYITHNQRIEAQKERINLASSKLTYSKYPYFIDYVSYLLRQTYGDDVVRRGGLRVYTTLDPETQEIAEKAIVAGVKSAGPNTGVKQGALISINVDSGYIQALVGGVDYSKSNFNRAVFAKRAAGSSFKPVVYLTGLRTGLITPNSPIVDAPISFNNGFNVWSPHNWDGKYMGKMTIRKALTLSRNTPTVRIAMKAGLDNIIETARLLGIKSPISRNFSIVLGSTGVSPLEMATVYSTIARDGIYIEPIAIRKVEDSEHNVLEENNPNPIRVVSPEYVRELTSILVDVVNKGTGKQAKLNDRPVAGKTGTTDDVRDIWFSGFTPDTVTTIWMGNDANTELHGVFSSNCAQLWQAFSKEYYRIKDLPPRYFKQPMQQADNKPDILKLNDKQRNPFENRYKTKSYKKNRKINKESPNNQKPKADEINNDIYNDADNPPEKETTTQPQEKYKEYKPQQNQTKANLTPPVPKSNPTYELDTETPKLRTKKASSPEVTDKVPQNTPEYSTE